jgi:hypothetical protein
MNENAFWQFDENRAKMGYQSAWLVKLPNRDKYSLVGLTTQVPYPFGDNETADVNILQGDGIGKIKGKFSMEPVDVPVYHHRDNAYRFNEIIGDQVCDFLSINSELTAYAFAGTLEYKPDTAEASENMATVTITPISGSKRPIYDAREMVEENVCLKNNIPETIKVGGSIDFVAKQTDIVTPSFKVEKIAPTTNVKSDMTASTDYTVDGTKITFNTTGLMVITVSATGYAPWTTTVYVESATN